MRLAKGCANWFTKRFSRPKFVITYCVRHDSTIRFVTMAGRYCHNLSWDTTTPPPPLCWLHSNSIGLEIRLVWLHRSIKIWTHSEFKRLKTSFCLKQRAECRKGGISVSVSISKGNEKLGSIQSVSLPSSTTCRPCDCIKKCYARRIERRRPSVEVAYKTNLRVLTENPDV